MNNVKLIQANCAIITAKDGTYLQSYNSIIAHKCIDGKIELDQKYWDYSATTRKHRALFLGEDSQTIKAKIASGTYKLVNLN